MPAFRNGRGTFKSLSAGRGSLRTAAWPYLALVAAMACSDGPAAPTGELLSICHRGAATPSIVDIRTSELEAHQAHGDYVARLMVEKSAVPAGDGIHFTRIGDAIAAARAGRFERSETSVAACRVTIAVGNGVFEGNVSGYGSPAIELFPFVIDVPDITLSGSFKMAIDAGGRATGDGQTAATTTLVANPGLLTTRLGGAQNFLAEPLIVITDGANSTGGTGGTSAVIEGFVMKSGNDTPNGVPGGNAVFSMRARDLVVRRNRMEGGFTEPLTLNVSTAIVEQNYLIGKGGSCAVCFSGPGTFDATGNRLMGPGGIPGILILPVSLLPVPPMVAQQVLPTSSVITATITNNDVRNHQQKPSGVGLRLGAIGLQGSNVVSTTRVVARGNTFANNTFGVMVEAAFPVLGTLLKGDVDLTLQGNTITGNCQNSLYVAFTRNSTGLGTISPAQFQTTAFLKNSTYALTLSNDVLWKDAWVANPEGLGNTLKVDNVVISSGTRVAYDSTKVCVP